MRDQDLSQIVHDFKNPLQIMELETSLMEAQSEERDPRRLRASLARIRRNIGFLDRMVHELLDLQAVETGDLTLHCESTSLRELLARTIDRTVPSRDRGRVILDAPDNVIAVVDELRIERVVANLMSNALKYAPAGSMITVRLVHDARRVRVSLSNEGPQLDATDAASLFGKYARGAAARHREGTGLGLYVSRRLIVAHGGRLDVECHEGEVQFFFELPARSRRGARGPAAETGRMDREHAAGEVVDGAEPRRDEGLRAAP